MKRKRTGDSLSARSHAGLLGLIGVCAFLSLSWPAGAVAVEKKKPEPYSLLAGTVFRETGLSLAGAEIVVTQLAEADAGKKSRKPKPVKAVSDARGEFAIRLPALPMRYTVSVKAPGYLAQEKQVSIQGEDRIDLFFQLKPARK